MTKYRKKPVVIEAIQYNNTNFNEIERFVGKRLQCDLRSDAGYQAGAVPPLIDVIIPTLEGDMRATYGDYIIKGVNGEFYPCKPDIFEKTYTSADETKPHFPLTAEEVETTRFALETAIGKHKASYEVGYYKMTSEEKGSFERVIYSERNLLTRIKQWQDDRKDN